MSGSRSRHCCGPPVTRAGLKVGTLAASLLGLFALDHLLLLHFGGSRYLDGRTDERHQRSDYGPLRPIFRGSSSSARERSLLHS